MSSGHLLNAKADNAARTTHATLGSKEKLSKQEDTREAALQPPPSPLQVDQTRPSICCSPAAAQGNRRQATRLPASTGPTRVLPTYTTFLALGRLHQGVHPTSDLHLHCANRFTGYRHTNDSAAPPSLSCEHPIESVCPPIYDWILFSEELRLHQRINTSGLQPSLTREDHAGDILRSPYTLLSQRASLGLLHHTASNDSQHSLRPQPQSISHQRTLIWV
ncbi:hypothetical protein HYQ44_007760 [Verticillium longisporum]|nr:hypothetical protein HYQ44_007760 [Verticillium longisporum]